MDETPDTRDPVDDGPGFTERGASDELRTFLEDALQIPKYAHRFTVTFERGKAVVVSVDYCPRERED